MKKSRRKRKTVSGLHSLGCLVIGEKSVTSTGVVKRIGSPTQRFAKRRRERPTKAEEELEHILNSVDHGIYKEKFQREWAFAGKWILDFFFVENRLGIEVDGEYHESDGQKAKDAKKSKACERFGITLLRLTNGQVFGDRDALLSKIREAHKEASRRHEGLPKLNRLTLSTNSEVKMELPNFELTEREEDLIDKHLSFYRALATGEQEPTTEAQRHFVAMCEGRVRAETDHEIAYAKFMRIQRAYKDNEGSNRRGIPEYEEGSPRPGWCTDGDWKRMRAGNYADMKKRQRGD